MKHRHNEAFTCIRTHTHKHTCMHARTHMHTHRNILSLTDCTMVNIVYCYQNDYVVCGQGTQVHGLKGTLYSRKLVQQKTIYSKH